MRRGTSDCQYIETFGAGCELTAVELRVGEESDIVGAICRLYHVAFESKSVL
jgi:hypothetical protein